MATCSVTDPFVVKANDFYKALAASMEDAEAREKRPRPRVESRPMTKDEVKAWLKARN